MSAKRCSYSNWQIYMNRNVIDKKKYRRMRKKKRRRGRKGEDDRNRPLYCLHELKMRSFHVISRDFK